MHVLITGGCGFIGSALVHLFNQRAHQVTVFDCLTYAGFYSNIKKISPKFYLGNLQNKQDIDACFQMYGPFDVVIHTAAESSVDKSIRGYKDFVLSNVLGSANLFQACMENKVQKIINFGTDEIFGHFEEDQKGKFKEDDKLNPRNIYSASKASQTLMARGFHITHELPVLTVCPANCYGPRQHAEKLIPKTVYCMLNELPIPLYNNGKNVREWLYVNDAAEAILTLINSGKTGEIYNIGTTQERSVINVIAAIQKILNVKPKFKNMGPRPGDDFRYGVSSQKINKLGWSPTINFEQGIRATIKWYLDNQDYLEASARRLDLGRSDNWFRRSAGQSS